MQRFYPYPPATTLELQRQVNELLEHGIISQTEYAESATPVVLVKKGTLENCILQLTSAS